LAITNFSDTSRIEIPYLYTYGFYGVQLFFVISGFIICSVAEKENFNRKNFLIKRFFRIYPLYAIFCISSFFAAKINLFWLGGHDYSFLTLLKSIAIIPQKEGPIYAVGWSLEHEIIFYIITALLIPLGGIRLLAVVIGIMAITSRYYGQDWDYKLLIQMPYFFVGIMIYMFQNYLFFMKWQAKNIFAKILVKIGDVSFSLYLVHWVIFAIMNRLSNYINSPSPLIEFWRLASIAISIASAFCLWHFLEKSIIKFGNKITINK